MAHKTNLDDPKTTIQHAEIIRKKAFLRKIYEDWYGQFINYLEDVQVEGKVLELGSGGGFLQDLLPEVITSDIMELPNCDICCKAEDIPFNNNSLKAVFMIDVMHHIPTARAFFKEMERTLKPGGIVYMIEPANTAFSRFILKNFHHEDFDENAKDWSFESLGPLSSSNQALPWIIFKRDREIFEKEFPTLQVKSIDLHTPFRYLISGGLSFNTGIPGWSFSTITFFEKLLKPIYGLSAMFQTIVLVKK